MDSTAQLSWHALAVRILCCQGAMSRHSISKVSEYPVHPLGFGFIRVVQKDFLIDYIIYLVFSSNLEAYIGTSSEYVNR